MMKVEEYKEAAKECRRLAGLTTTGAKRDALLALAKQWELMAEQRQHAVDKKRKIMKIIEGE